MSDMKREDGVLFAFMCSDAMRELGNALERATDPEDFALVQTAATSILTDLATFVRELDAGGGRS